MTSQDDLAGLFNDAGLDDDLTQALVTTVDDLGPAIMAGLGDIGSDQIHSDEVLLFTMIDDNSSSIHTAKNTQHVIDGSNLVVKSLRDSKSDASVLISCRYLNDQPGVTNHGVLYPYVALDQAVLLDSHNYRPRGTTPLYDVTAATLAAVQAKMTEFDNANINARAVTVIVGDGADVGSFKNIGAVNNIVTGLLATELHIVMALGISDAPESCPRCYADLKGKNLDHGLCINCQAPVATDFRQVFSDMGIPEQWILTPANSASDLRQAFDVVSKSAVRASQAAGGSFSQVAMGGGFATV